MTENLNLNLHSVLQDRIIVGLGRLRRDLQLLKKEIYKSFSEREPFNPHVFTGLASYRDTKLAASVFHVNDQDRCHAVSKSTSLGVCEPWIDLKLSSTVAAKPDPYKLIPKTKIINKSPPELDKERPAKVGSTSLPVYSIIMDKNSATEYDKEDLFFTDIPKIRKTISDRFLAGAKERIAEDYQRTMNDFFRMELDKIDLIHPINRENMREIFLAYLRNSTGSKKALCKCLNLMDKRLEHAINILANKKEPIKIRDESWNQENPKENSKDSIPDNTETLHDDDQVEA